MKIFNSLIVLYCKNNFIGSKSNYVKNSSMMSCKKFWHSSDQLESYILLFW